MIHTTAGVYPNGSYKINGVPSENLAEHIAYNVEARFGRALFLDGKLIYEGIACDGAIKELTEKIKIMRKLTILILLFTTILLNSQEQLRLSLNQDVRLAVLGDDKGNDAFTPALMFRLDMQGKQQKHGYMVVGIELEYADLKDINTTLEGQPYTIENNFKRYSVNVGYTFNKLFLDYLEATAVVNYGMIDRWGKSFMTASCSGTLSYNIYRNIGFQFIGQFIQRKDKEWAYGEDAKYTLNGLELDFSFLFGIYLNI